MIGSIEIGKRQISFTTIKEGTIYLSGSIKEICNQLLDLIQKHKIEHLFLDTSPKHITYEYKKTIRNNFPRIKLHNLL